MGGKPGSEVGDLVGHVSRIGGYLVLIPWVARAMATWAMPQLEGGVRHGLKVSRFPGFWPSWGDGHTP